MKGVYQGSGGLLRKDGGVYLVCIGGLGMMKRF